VLRIIIKFFSLHSNLSHLMSFFLTFQNSLFVHILSNYSNFINTIALLKCIIKRTMLTLTDTFHSVQQFRDNSSWKLIHLTWWTINLSLTFQNSLSVHIFLNHSNFIDTIALLKCIIKRTMLTLTDTFHSVQQFRNNSSWKLIHLTWCYISYFLKFSTGSYFIKLLKFHRYCCITQMHYQENNADFNR